MDHSQSLTLLFLLFSVCVVSLSGVAADECTDAIKIGNLNKRVVGKALGLKDAPLSDASIDTNVWYRFESPKGNQIPGSCVKSYHCGTNSPIWIKGSHPTAEQAGPVTVEACAQLRCDGDCCGWTGNVQVKWCKNATTDQVYFAYKLTAPPFPGMAYCAGEITLCGATCTLDPQTSKCNCPAHPTISKPVCSRPYVSNSKTVTDPAHDNFLATVFSIDCTIGYPKQDVDDGARFDVAVESNGVEFYRLKTTSAHTLVKLDEVVLYGHLGKSIQVKVFPYWKEAAPDPAVSQTSEEVWIGLRPHNEKGEEITAPVKIKEGELFRFKFVSNFPISSPGCFNTSLNVSCHPFYPIKILAKEDGRIDSCAFELTPASNFSDFITIMPKTTVCKKVENYVWEINFEKKTDDTIFRDYQIPPLIIHIEDQIDRPVCRSNGDPHINTFPIGTPLTSKYYHIYTMGDYYLVNATSRRFEIQVRQYDCATTATCNCAIMVREGNNIFGMDVCQPTGEPRKPDISPRLVRLLVDKTHPSGTISIKGQTYYIATLSGVVIEVTHAHLPSNNNDYLDIQVNGLNTDKYTGLCTFNPPSNEYQCTTECDQYRVPEEESLFNYNSTNIPKCGESYSIPTCDCSVQEDNKYCKSTSFVLDQSNLLKTNFTCDGPSMYQVVIEENSLDIDVLVQIRVHTSSSFTSFSGATWPTIKNKITEEMAKAECQKMLLGSGLQSLCGNRSDIDTASLITGCTMDIQISDDLSISRAIQSQFETSCQYSIESSRVETNNPNDAQVTNIPVQELAKIKALMCPMNCKLRGNCVNGTCVCNPGFAGRFCGLIVGQVPIITKLVDVTCDLQVKTCKKVFVIATNVSRTEALTCRLNSTVDGIQYDKSPMHNFDIIICTLPEKPNSDIYQVSISNDGAAYSEPQTFTVFHGSKAVGTPGPPVAVPAATA